MPTSSITAHSFVVAAAVMMCLLPPQAARAGLGDPESAIPVDVQRMGGSIKSSARSSYRIHEIQMSSGTVLREFASAEGTVFAVAWSGPTLPDLRQALGHYFDAYASAAQGSHSARRHLEIKQTDWVMQSSGHMRAFRGRAYLPKLIPVGTSLDEIH